MKFNKLLRITTISIVFLALGMLITFSTIFSAETDSANRCNSITLENAARILDVSLDDLQKSISGIMVSPDDIRKKTFKIAPYNCAIRSKSNFLKGINYIVYVYNDPGQARKDFNKMQESYGTISKVDTVPDIGDETFWASDKRFQRMVSIKGDVMIDVLSPKESNLQKQIIHLILDKF